jgi:hypothetical protein
MAERRTASAPGAATPAPAQPTRGGEPERHQTARVPSSAGAQLPNWFWAALGCLIVLAVGFTIMFFFGRASADAAPRAAVAVPVPSPTAGQAKGIQVEQLAPPPAPAPPPPRRTAPRAIKVARSPSPGAAATTTSRPGADDDAAVEAAFGITGDKADKDETSPDHKSDDRKGDREKDDDEPMPRKARVLAAPPATERQGQAEDKESP